MGRYDKIRSWNGSSWTQPSRVRVNALNRKIRYIYIYQNGSNVNTGNHLCQIEAYTKDGVNVAVGKTVTCGGASGLYVQNPGNCVKASLDSSYAETFLNGSWYGSGRTWFIVDLGQAYDLDYIKVWRYYPDGRTYYETAICVIDENGYETRLHEYTQEPLYAESSAGYTGKWVDLGTNDSTNKRQLKVWDGSSWVRKSLEKTYVRTDYTFDAWNSFWPNGNGNFGSRNNGTHFSNSNFNCDIPVGYADWNAYSWDLLDWDNIGGYGWASTNMNYPNVWRNFYFRWPNYRKWIHNIVFWSASSSLWTGCPSKTEFWVGDKATFIGNYNFSNPGARDTSFYTTGIDYKPNGGITGIALAIYDGDGWKRANYSLRMRALHIEGGDCHTVDVYEWR